MRGHLVRLALILLSLFLLHYFGLLRFSVLSALYHKPLYAIAAGLLQFATFPVGALRWHTLLRCQGFRLPLRKTFEVVLVGQFFNTFLPGAYGGDVMRAGYIYHGARREPGKLLISILVDRLAGLSGMVVLAIFTQFALPAGVDWRLTLIIVGLAFAIVLGASLLPLLGKLVAKGVARFSNGLGKRLEELSGQFEVANKTYANRLDILAVAVFLSAVQFAFALASILIMASAFDFAAAHSTTIIYAGIISLIANAVPITPGGIGVGEAAFANAVRLIEPTALGPYATIFLAVRAVSLLVNLVGGVVFLIYRSEVIEYVAQARVHTDGD